LDLGVYMKEVKVQFWLVKVDIIMAFKKADRKPAKMISLPKIFEYLNQGYDCLDLTQDRERFIDCKNSIHFLEDLYRDINQHVTHLVDDPNLEEKEDYLGFIDLKPKIKEVKAAAAIYKRKLQRGSPLTIDQVETAPTSRHESCDKSRKGEEIEDGEIFVDQQEILVKKRRIEDKSLSITIESINEEAKVGWSMREQTRNEIFEVAKSLEGFEKLKSSEKAVKEVERKIFGRYHHAKNEYEERAKSICSFLGKLKKYQKVWKKILEKDLAYREIRRFMKVYTELKKVAQENEKSKDSLIEGGRNEMKGDMKEIPIELKRLLEMNKFFESKMNGKGSIWSPPITFDLPNLDGLTIPDKFTPEELKEISEGPPLEIEDFEPGRFNIQKKQTLNIKLMNYSGVIEIEDQESAEIQNKFLKTDDVDMNEVDKGVSSSQVDEQKARIMQVFIGSISQKLNQKLVEIPKCSFYTYASLTELYKFPNIPDDHLAFGNAKADSFFSQMNKFVYKQKSGFQEVLIGWVLDKHLKTKSFEKMIPTLKSGKKVGRCSCSQGVEIYLIPAVLFREESLVIDEKLRKFTSWLCQDHTIAPIPDQQLLFAMCLTSSSKNILERCSLMVEKSFGCRSNTYGPGTLSQELSKPGDIVWMKDSQSMGEKNDSMRNEIGAKENEEKNIN